MDIGTILLWSFLLFVIIYSSVRLAVKPLVFKPDKVITHGKDLGLVKLRDIEVLTNTELEQAIKLYQNKGISKEDYEQYKKYEKVLNELKEAGFFSDEQYLSKINILKKYFKVG